MIVNELHGPIDTTGLIREVTRWWNNSPTENGINIPARVDTGKRVKTPNPEYAKQLAKEHLPSILSVLKSSSISWDKRSRSRDPATAGIGITTLEMFNKIVKQECKCYYTRIPFSWDRDNWRYFSLERLDNSLGHTDENTVFICRMFNTAGQLNRNKLLTCLLSQLLVPLSDDDKTLIIAARDMENDTKLDDALPLPKSE